MAGANVHQLTPIQIFIEANTATVIIIAGVLGLALIGLVTVLRWIATALFTRWISRQPPLVTSSTTRLRQSFENDYTGLGISDEFDYQKFIVSAIHFDVIFQRIEPNPWDVDGNRLYVFSTKADSLLLRSGKDVSSDLYFLPGHDDRAFDRGLHGGYIAVHLEDGQLQIVGRALLEVIEVR